MKLTVYSIAQSAYYTYQGTGTNWTENPASTPSVLGDLTNVSAASPSDGQVLTWVLADGKWEPKNADLHRDARAR